MKKVPPWYELYFDDYGDVALLDINNNGVACDEIRSSETSTESEETTTTTLETSTTTTTLPTETNVENTVQSFEDIGFNLNDAVRNSKNKEALTNYFDIPNRVSSWSNFSGLRIETHWKTGIFLKWNGCDYTMGCIYKLSINGENFGSHFYNET